MNILLIDDDKDYCLITAKDASENFSINIDHFQNHQDGFAALEKNPLKYSALILDARCLINADAVESDEALAVALEMLANFEKKTERYLPFVVNTNYPNFVNYFGKMLEAKGAKIFRKSTTDSEKLFDYLKIQVKNSQNYQIERKYADIFEIFEKGYLGSDVKDKLLSILKNIENKKFDKDTLTDIRKLFEKLRSSYLPAIQPDGIHPFTKAIWSVASYYLHQNSPNPSEYVLRSLNYALLEILLWFKAEKEK